MAFRELEKLVTFNERPLYDQVFNLLSPRDPILGVDLFSLRPIMSSHPDLVCLSFIRCLSLEAIIERSALIELILKNHVPPGIIHSRFKFFFTSCQCPYYELTSIGSELLHRAIQEDHLALVVRLLRLNVVPSAGNIRSLLLKPEHYERYHHIAQFPKFHVIRRALRNFDLDHFYPSEVQTMIRFGFGSPVSKDEEATVFLIESYLPDSMILPSETKMHRALLSYDLGRVLDLLISGHCLPSPLPDCWWMEHLPRVFNTVWNPDNPMFFLYGAKFRDTMSVLCTILTFSMRTGFEGIPLPYLPAEMWQTIMQFLRRIDFYDSSIHHTIRTEECDDKLRMYFFGLI